MDTQISENRNFRNKRVGEITMRVRVSLLLSYFEWRYLCDAWTWFCRDMRSWALRWARSRGTTWWPFLVCSKGQRWALTARRAPLRESHSPPAQSTLDALLSHSHLWRKGTATSNYQQQILPQKYARPRFILLEEITRRHRSQWLNASYVTDILTLKKLL